MFYTVTILYDGRVAYSDNQSLRVYQQTVVLWRRCTMHGDPLRYYTAAVVLVYVGSAIIRLAVLPLPPRPPLRHFRPPTFKKTPL